MFFTKIRISFILFSYFYNKKPQKARSRKIPGGLFYQFLRDEAAFYTASSSMASRAVSAENRKDPERVYTSTCPPT